MTHVDVGLMQMYCNYVKENWTLPDENLLIGLVLCADKGHALARCALEELPSKIMAANDRTVLPDAELPQTELGKTRRMLEGRTTHLRRTGFHVVEQRTRNVCSERTNQAAGVRSTAVQGSQRVNGFQRKANGTY